MNRIRKTLATLGLAAFLAASSSIAASPALAHSRYGEQPRGFNGEYVYAATRAVNDMPDVNPAVKVTILPITIVLDTAFLPFAVLAGFIA
jgi:uncharacterized protein YceK